MEDNRKHPRVLVHWRSAIVTEINGKSETTQGTTNDISADGVSVICHRNISPNHVVTVYLLIHTGNEDKPDLVFEAQGKIMNNVLSGKQGGFRLGIQFTKFAGESKKMLEKYIPKNHGYGAAVTKDVGPPAKAVPDLKTAPAADAAAAAEVAPTEGGATAAEAGAPEATPSAADTSPAEDVAPAPEAAPTEDSAPAEKPPQ